MAGWRKAWLSVLGRSGGGGSTGSLQAHLQGGHGHHHLSPSSSSSSSLSGTKPPRRRNVGGKEVVICLFAALALAFFYASVVTGNGPDAADGSFPSSSSRATSSSSSALLQSWMKSSTTAPEGKKPLAPPPRLPVPPAGTARSSAGADQQGRDAVVASRRVQSSAAGNSSGSNAASGQAAPVRVQTASGLGHSPLRDAGNSTVPSDAEPAGNGTREEEPQLETAMRAPQTEDDTDNTTRNSTDAKAPSRQETTKNAAIDDNAQNTTRQAAPTRDRKEERRRHRRAARRRHARRRKDVIVHPAASEHSDGGGKTAGVNRTSTDHIASGNETAGVTMNASGVAPGGNNRVVWTPGVQDLVSFANCDVYNGRWVRDEGYGFYPPKSCPLIDDDFNCHKNGRPDTEFLKWRWQPHGCDIPRLNASEFLERLRGQRIIFVGDSLNRNMWESLVCTLRHGVRDKSNVYEASGRNRFKTRGYYSFKFREGNHVYPSLEVLDAYKKALTTWARWVDKNTDARRTQVVFRGYSLEHFRFCRRGGLWNSGGRCHRETEPIFNQTYLTDYPEKMVVLEQVLRQMKTPVIYLNISRLTDYRKDGHPSVYRIRYDTEEERMAAVTKQDCSHWCLPGVPDTWNELLYASLLQAGKGSWKL
ncbi:hypothetical protein PR202_ga19738 [Eleusine coracana subsp. coracana]|uniref:Trichome birefringence-like N-terminal domain-containing protein n=1 Tax=Eleusine coracana subsp. coracana TaxID=191504 RepID=A0AAV5CWW3_ELECO|nr:hypothetical protein PR202_ga19738 [Eleusine coracana subsp. coracana]